MPDTSADGIAVGDVRIHPLVDIDRLLMDPDGFFDRRPSAPPGQRWCDSPPYWDLESDSAVLSVHAFLIDTGTEKILLDGGVGNGKTFTNPAFANRATEWTALLGQAGAALSDIHIVVFTHLHPDHVGLATTWDGDAWRPTFANARHLVSSSEYAFWTSTGPAQARMLADGDFVTESVLPLIENDLIEQVDVATNEQLPIADGVRLLATPGHTPGSLSVAISSRGAEALLIGDAVHHPIQCADPTLNSIYCTDPARSAVQRRALLDHAADTRALVVPSHFPAPSAGYVRRDGNGYHFELLAKD